MPFLPSSNIMILGLHLLAAVVTAASGANQEQQVKMYSFQRGLWTLPTTEAYLRYNFSSNLQLYNFTICYWLRHEQYADTTVHLSYALSHENSDALLIFEEEGFLQTYMLGKLLSVPLKRPLEVFPETWNHLCHVIQEKQYTVYWQGKVFASGHQEESLLLPLNGTLIVGQEQDKLGGGFLPTEIIKGDMSHLNIWDSALPSSEVMAMAQCHSVSHGNVFSFDSADVELFGAVQETQVDLPYFCGSVTDFVLVLGHLSMQDAALQCSLFGMDMAVPVNSSENQQLLSLLTPYLDVCSSGPFKLWLGITDEAEENVWVNVNTNKQQNYQNFRPSDSGGGRLTNCAHILQDGFWGNAVCSYLLCYACQGIISVPLYLRGLCIKNSHQLLFRLDKDADGQILFRGFYSKAIFWKKETNKWVLQDLARNVTLAQLFAPDIHSYPLGLREWETNEAICGQDQDSIPLSLSACTSLQFMCASGKCINKDLRCDLRYDCLDRTDEDDCEIIKTNNAYRRSLPPAEPNGSALILKSSVTIVRFADISDLRMTVSVEFQINLTWRDTRLTFGHLKAKKKQTILTEDDLAKIWVPKYQFVNVEGGNSKLLSSTAAILSARNAILPDHNSVNLDLMYPGGANDLSLTRQHLGAFTCDFQLYSYPFDVQVCSLDLRLPPAYEDYVKLSLTNRTVSYTGAKTLPMYRIQSVRFAPDTDEMSLRVEFEMHRREGVIVVTTFLPSVLLLLVSWSTLFVKLEALNVRAVMALTTLLVLYTLFTNTSRLLPATATIKLIDVWFTFIILLLFINIMIHIFVNKGEDEGLFQFGCNILKVRSTEKVTNAPISNSIPASVKFLFVYRMIVFPCVFVIFTLVFCCLCFL